MKTTSKLQLLLQEYNIQLLPYEHGGKGIYGVEVHGGSRYQIML